MTETSPIAFDITIPSPGCLIRVEIVAGDWIEAWQLALAELGTTAAPADVDCGIYPGDKVVVTVKATGVRLELRSSGRLVKPAGPAHAPDPTRPKRPTPVLQLPVVARRSQHPMLGPIPSVGQLDEGAAEAALQILGMLAAHLGATTTLYVAKARRGCRTILGSQGDLAVGLEAIVGNASWLTLAESQPLRLGFAADSTLMCRRCDGVLRQLDIRNVAAAPVRGGGMFLLLDGPKSGRVNGFSDGELDALTYAAELVSRRRVV